MLRISRDFIPVSIVGLGLSANTLPSQEPTMCHDSSEHLTTESRTEPPQGARSLEHPFQGLDPKSGKIV